MEWTTAENHYAILLHLFVWTASVLRVIVGISFCILGLVSSSFLNLLNIAVD
jgi:hypothetical protein